MKKIALFLLLLIGFGASKAYASGFFGGTVDPLSISSGTIATFNASTATITTLTVSSGAIGGFTAGTSTSTELNSTLIQATTLNGTTMNGTTINGTVVTISTAVLGYTVLSSSAVTIPDNGHGAVMIGSVTVVSALVVLSCADNDGCELLLEETGARLGQVVTILHTGSPGATNVIDTPGRQEVTSGTTFSMSTDENIGFMYNGSAWVEYSGRKSP